MKFIYLQCNSIFICIFLRVAGVDNLDCNRYCFFKNKIELNLMCTCCMCRKKCFPVSFVFK